MTDYMKLKKCLLFIVLCLTMLLVFTACKKAAEEEKEETITEGEPESLEYWDLINEKLNNNELLKENPNVVFHIIDFYISPFISDTELDELVDVLVSVSKDIRLIHDYAFVNVKCYNYYINVELENEINRRQLQSELQDLVKEQKEIASVEMDSLYNSIKKFDNIFSADKGEWYFIINDNNFDNDWCAIAETLEKIEEINPLEKYPAYDFAYGYSPETGYEGFVGDKFIIYRNSVSPENIIGKYLFIQYSLAARDVFNTYILDYSPFVETYTDNGFQSYIELSFNSGKFHLLVRWNEHNSYLSMDKLADHTYKLYEEVRLAAAKINCSVLGYLGINAKAPHEYNVENDELFIDMDFNKEYTLEEWKKKLKSKLERKFESEPM